MMENISSWPSGTLSEGLSNDSVMILLKSENEANLSSELAANAEHDLSSQSFFIPTNFKSDLDNITALNAFQLDANGQLIPLYTDLEDENRLMLENESLDSSLLLLKNNGFNSVNADNLSLKNLLGNDIIITVPLGESKLPDFLNVQLKSKDPVASLPPTNNTPSTDYVEERLKIFKNILVEKKKKRIKHAKVEKNGNAELAYTCEFCCMEFEKSHQYFGHLHVHSGEQTWECEKCECSFVTQYQLRRHERRYHQDYRPHVCSICNKTFERLSQLDYHRRRVHEKERSFKCQICSKGFFKGSDLKTHLNIHLKVNGCVCETCGRRFSHVSNLIRHKRTHSGVRPYLCRFCGRRFSQVTTLNEHKLSHSEATTKAMKCPHCSESVAPRLLSKHLFDAHGILEKKEGVAEKRRYYCKICGDRFPFVNALKKHEHDVHLCEKSLTCSKCKKEFDSLDLLLKHCCEKKRKSSHMKVKKKRSASKPEENLKTDSLSQVSVSSTHSISNSSENPVSLPAKDSFSLDVHMTEDVKNFTFQRPDMNCSANISKVENRLNVERPAVAPGASHRPDSPLETTNLDLSVEILDVTDLKASENLDILNKELLKAERQIKNETDIVSIMEHKTLELPVSDCFLPNEKMDGNYITIDLDFSMNGILNATTDIPNENYSKSVGSSDKALPPLIPLCDRYKDMFDSSDASENMIKLVGSHSCLDYKGLLNDQPLILDASEHKLAETLSQFGESLLKSVLMVNSNAKNNAILNDESYDTNYTGSHDSKNEGFLSDVNPPDIIVEPKNENLGRDTGEENLLNQFLILPPKSDSKSDLVYVCTHCNKAFVKLEDLTQHAESLNIPPKALLNTPGTHVLRSKNKLALKPQLYLCSYCDKSFKKLKNLNQHVGLHNAAKCKYRCDICGQHFAWKTTLNRHMAAHRINEAPKFACEMCDKVYATASRVHEHVKRDHYNQRPHICRICAKCFFKKSDLVGHMRTHTQEKPYMCGTCARSFRHVSHLIRHERIHTGLKPYKCSYCPNSFTQLGVLKNHMKIKHPDAKVEKT